MLVITIITYSLPSTIAGVCGQLQILKIINCEYFLCDLAQRDNNECRPSKNQNLEPGDYYNKRRGNTEVWRITLSWYI